MQHEHLVLVDELLHCRDALRAVAGIVLEHGLDLAAVHAALVIHPLVIGVEPDLRLAVARSIAGERPHHADLDTAIADAVLGRRTDGEGAGEHAQKMFHAPSSRSTW